MRYYTGNQSHFSDYWSTQQRYKSQNFSYCSLFKESCPYALSGAALLSIGKYLPFVLAAHVPPLALTLLLVAGSVLLAYGIYQGLRYATTEVPQDGVYEDIESVDGPSKSWWKL